MERNFTIDLRQRARQLQDASCGASCLSIFDGNLRRILNDESAQATLTKPVIVVVCVAYWRRR